MRIPIGDLVRKAFRWLAPRVIEEAEQDVLRRHPSDPPPKSDEWERPARIERQRGA